MSVAARQYAWLYARPKAAERKKEKPPEGSRLESLKAKGIEPKVPECELQYLLDLLFEIGPTEPSGFGPAPLSHREILAWSELSGLRLQPWEVRLIRRLSSAYIGESSRAEDPDARAPFESEPTEQEQRAVATSLRDTIRGMAS